MSNGQLLIVHCNVVLLKLFAMKLSYLFVYGSLRMGFQNEAYHYISEYFEFVSLGKVRGALYDSGSYPVGKPAEEEIYITGELYKIKDPQLLDWAFTQLDDYEGVCVENDEPQMYVRAECDVNFNNETARAYVYWYNGDTANMPQLARILIRLHKISK